MRLYRPIWKDKDGQRHTSERWWIDWTDGNRRRWRLPGLTDKRQTEAIARNVERLIGVRGDVLPADLLKWLEAQPADFRERLAKAGLIDTERVGGILPLMLRNPEGKIIGGHLADFLADVQARGIGDGQRATLGQRIRDILMRAGVVFSRDLSAARIQAAIATLATPTKEHPDGLSLQSLHHYVRAVRQFSRWLYREKRTAEDTLMGVKGYNADTDPRRQRRGFTSDEIKWLLATTKTGDVRGALSGQSRAAVYALAFASGLRRNEIRTLTRASFDLEADPPTVTVEAAYSKHRRTDVQPLPADVAAMLAGYLATAEAERPFPLPCRAAEMLRADMKAAREKWIEAAANDQERQTRTEDADFLQPSDSAGLVLDFHSHRHGYVTAICKAAVSPRVMMSLARHSDPRLTMKRYSRVAIADAAAALDVLPNLADESETQAASLRATGTDNANAAQDAPGRPRIEYGASGRTMDRPSADADGRNTGNPAAFRVSAFAKSCGQERISANVGEQNAAITDNAKSLDSCGKPAYSAGVVPPGGVSGPGGHPGLQNQCGALQGLGWVRFPSTSVPAAGHVRHLVRQGSDSVAIGQSGLILSSRTWRLDTIHLQRPLQPMIE